MVITARPTRRRRPIGTILILLLIAAGLSYVLIPLAFGRQPNLPFSLNEIFAGNDSDDSVKPPAEGKVRVLVSGREIPAYTKISRDDLWDPQKNHLAFTDVDEDLIGASGILVEASQIVGRVLDHKKPAGYVFTEKDFMPKGTRPGFVRVPMLVGEQPGDAFSLPFNGRAVGLFVTAGPDAGTIELRIEVDWVHGIVGLQPGDRFDILAAVPVESSTQVPFSGVFADQMKVQTQLEGLNKQARVDVLVQNGVVVSELQTRQVPITQSSLTRGTTTRTVPKQEMVIAVGPDEVAELMEAIAIEAQVTCIARSGHPDDPLESRTLPSKPNHPWLSTGGGGRSGAGGGHVIEVIDEGERKLVPVPSSFAEGSGSR